MRPIGVLSKKAIGARSPLFRIEVCSSVAEFNTPLARANAEHSTKIPGIENKHIHAHGRFTTVPQGSWADLRFWQPDHKLRKAQTRLPLLSNGPKVTFPATENHCSLDGAAKQKSQVVS